MLIDIPEQTNCGCCPFNVPPCGKCTLGDALGQKYWGESCDYANKGWDLEKDEECRPDWCPFKTTAEMYNKIIEASIKMPI